MVRHFKISEVHHQLNLQAIFGNSLEQVLPKNTQTTKTKKKDISTIK
jgi:hypothetical protein